MSCLPTWLGYEVKSIEKGVCATLMIGRQKREMLAECCAKISISFIFVVPVIRLQLKSIYSSPGSYLQLICNSSLFG